MLSQLGLGSSVLTRSRTNGFLNMLEAVKRRARALLGDLPRFPSLLISAAGTSAQGAFAEAQVGWLAGRLEWLKGWLGGVVERVLAWLIGWLTKLVAWKAGRAVLWSAFLQHVLRFQPGVPPPWSSCVHLTPTLPHPHPHSSLALLSSPPTCCSPCPVAEPVPAARPVGGGCSGVTADCEAHWCGGSLLHGPAGPRGAVLSG